MQNLSQTPGDTPGDTVRESGATTTARGSLLSDETPTRGAPAMSIICAYISPRSGVVASDGRRFASARYEHGKLTAPPESDDSDKTFALKDGQVVGAYCGLLAFGGRDVSAHIAEIADSVAQGCRDLAALSEAIAAGLSGRLTQIDPDEVLFCFRTTEVLIVGGEHFTRKDMRIVYLRFFPEQDKIQTVVDLQHADPGGKRFYVRGECKAQAAAEQLFQADQRPSTM